MDIEPLWARVGAGTAARPRKAAMDKACRRIRIGSPPVSPHEDGPGLPARQNPLLYITVIMGPCVLLRPPRPRRGRRLQRLVHPVRQERGLARQGEEEQLVPEEEVNPLRPAQPLVEQV